MSSLLDPPRPLTPTITPSPGRYWGSTTDIPAISNEVAAGLFTEVDLRREARNAAAFAAAHAHLPYMTVPRHAPALSARRVMTSEWVDGYKLPDLGKSNSQ